MWVGAPREVSEQGGAVDPAAAPGAPTFRVAPLQCNPHYTDWTAYGGPGAPFGLGGIHLYHPLIVPGGRYEIAMLRGGCAAANATNFSAPLSITQSRFGNVAGPFDVTRQMWTAPEPSGQVDVTVDVIAVLGKFANRANAPTKIRTDIEPATADQKINISDVTRTLDAFRSLPYPFPPPLNPPCP
jgi:hypothetical protein